MGFNDIVTLVALFLAITGIVLALWQARQPHAHDTLASVELGETLRAHIDYAQTQIATNVRNIAALEERLEEEQTVCQRAVKEMRDQYQQSRREHEACERDRANLQRQLLEMMNQQPRRGGGL